MSSAAAHMAVVRAAADGDDAALATLVKLYHDRVYRFGLRACRDHFDADDAVQEAFIKLARRPDVQTNPGTLAWLLAVVKSACLRMLRPISRQRRALGEPIEADQAGSELPDAQRALEKFELVSRVHAAIAGLPEAYRSVLVLRDLEGLTGEETAQALGLDLSAMKSRLHRARSTVRERLLVER